MLRFVHQAIRDIRTVGSIAPSSAALARAMTKGLRARLGSRRVLEVGAGTGAFTEAILSTLRPGDHFDVVEVNPSFASAVERRLIAPYRASQPSATVTMHATAIELAALDGNYDFVVCGLPFNNFPPDVTQSIFTKMIDLMRAGGELTYFEYVAVRALKKPFAGAGGRSRIHAHEAFLRSTARDHTVTGELVLGNIPPAKAVRLVKRSLPHPPCSASTTTF
jgi:phospholipid N-methyltransferase